MASDPVQLDYTIVDVFTETKYEGNPLAIVRVPRSCTLSQDQKQAIAREFNLSETTFLHEQEEADKSAGSNQWKVDIFTTNEELPFAGHPTIGTACFALSDFARASGATGNVDAQFRLKAGMVQIKYNVAQHTAKAAIPHNVRIHEQTWSRNELFKFQPQLEEAFAKGKFDVKERHPVISIVKGMTFVLVELKSLEALQHVGLSGRRLLGDEMQLDEGWSRTFVGVYFFARCEPGPADEIQLRTRMIEGTLEDPATGSAASALTAYLSIVEGNPGQTLDFTLTQGVEMGRRSNIRVQVRRDREGVHEIILGGSAVQVMAGRLTV